MPLTAEQQTRLDELNRRAGVTQSRPTGLTPQQSARLNELNQKAAATVKMAEKEQLLGQLGGAMPDVSYKLDDPLIRKAKTPEFIEREAQRRQAYTKLVTEHGVDYDQLQAYLSAQRAMRPKPFEGKGGQIIGSAIGGAVLPWVVNQLPFMKALPEEKWTRKLGIYIGGVLGEAIGGGVGKAIEQAIDPYDDMSWDDILGAVGEEAAYGAGSRVGFGALGYAGKGIRNFLRPKAKPGAKAAMKRFADASFGKAKALLPPSNISEGPHGAMEMLTRTAFGSEKKWREFDRLNERVFWPRLARKTVSEIGDSTISANPRKAGELFYKRIARKGVPITGPLDVAMKSEQGVMAQALEDITKPLYDKFDELTEGVQIPTTGIKKWAKKIIAGKKYADMPPLAKAKFRSLAAMSDSPLTTKEARFKWQKVKEVLRYLEKKEELGRGELTQISKQWNDILFNQNIPGLTTEHRALLRQADGIYKAGKTILASDEFSFQMARKLAKDPQMAREVLFPAGTKPGSGAMRRIQALKEGLVNEPGPYFKLKAGQPGGRLVKSQEGTAAWDALRQSWAAGEMEAGTLADSMKKMGKETLGEMFNPEEIRSLNLYLDIGERMKPAAHLGGGALAVRSAQIAQVMAGGGLLLYGGIRGKGDKSGAVILGSGGVLLMGPRVYAELATKGIIGQSVMRQVARHNSRPTARTAGPLAVKVVRLLKAMDKEEVAKILKERRRKNVMQKAAQKEAWRKAWRERAYGKDVELMRRVGSIGQGL